MMPQANQPQDVEKSIAQIKEFISKNSSGIIVLPAKATPDAIAAGSSLYLALMKLGKNISLVSSSAIQSDMFGADKVKTDLQAGGDNLVVSFPYQEGSIDKVDYNIQGERFNLVIVPRQGSNKLKSEDISFSYTGGKIDFIITVDAPNLNALGEIYQTNQRQFEGSTIINIDRHLINNSYGMINLISKSSSSTSELACKVIEGLKIEMDTNIATNLYAGIVAATNNFTAYSVNADTFEVIAKLLRAGAIKKPMQALNGNQFSRQMGNSFESFGQRQPSFGGGQFGDPMPQQFNPQPMPRQQQPQPIPFNSPQVAQKQPQMQSFENQAKSDEGIERSPNVPEGQVNSNETAENFLKPKIFSGSGGLV